MGGRSERLDTVQGLDTNTKKMNEYALTFSDTGNIMTAKKYINAQYFVTLSFRNRKEKIAVDWVTFDKAIVGKVLTIKR